MAIVKWIVIVALALAIIAVVAGQLGLFSGRAPDNLGLRDSRLKPPSKTPNSVSSQVDLWPEHVQRDAARIAPLALRGDGPATMARLKTIVEAMPGAKLIEARPDYLYVQFTTRLMKFIDDTEFWFDPAAGVVQVRSASRVGNGDLGVNRKRIEVIRALLATN